jgi:hypothetical protein
MAKFALWQQAKRLRHGYIVLRPASCVAFGPDERYYQRVSLVFPDGTRRPKELSSQRLGHEETAV